MRKSKITWTRVDRDTFNANPMQMYAVASDVTFGTPAYLHVQSLPEDIWKVQASASMPLVSKTVEQEGHRYLDGGTADSIPSHLLCGCRARDFAQTIPYQSGRW